MKVNTRSVGTEVCMKKDPSSWVIVVVPEFLSLTETPGSGEPSLSRTVPRSETTLEEVLVFSVSLTKLSLIS